MPPKRTSIKDGTSGAAEQSLNVALLKSSSTSACVFALVGLVGMIIQNEIAWYYNTIAQYGPLCPDARDETCDPRVNAAMWPIRNQLSALDGIRAALITVPTVASIAYIYIFYSALLELEKIKIRQPASATLLSVPRLRWGFFLEVLAVAVHVFPTVETLSASPDLYLFLSQVWYARVFKHIPLIDRKVSSLPIPNSLYPHYCAVHVCSSFYDHSRCAVS